MIEFIDDIRENDNPVMKDKIITAIREKMAQVIPWMDYAFGSVYPIKTEDLQGNTVIVPAVYKVDNSYINLSPNKEFGNHCFFETINNGDSVKDELITGGFNIVFWLNMDKIYPRDYTKKENVKAELFGFLHKYFRNVDIVMIHEKFSSVFSEYTYREMDTQLMTAPYFGLKFECKTNYIAPCYNG